MQQAAKIDDDALVSIAVAARAVGVNRSTLGRQVKAGLIRSHGGQVRLSEVRQDRANNIDQTIWAGRAKRNRSRDDLLHAPVHRPGPAHAPRTRDGADLDDDDSSNTPLGKAKTRKENYIAKIRELEFETKSGRLVDAEAVKGAVFEMSRQDRDALANWPSQNAAVIAAEFGIDAARLAVVLEDSIRAFLRDRANSALRFTAAGK